MASGVAVDTNPRVGVGPAGRAVAVDGGAMVAAGPPQAMIRRVIRASRPGSQTPFLREGFRIFDIGISCLYYGLCTEYFESDADCSIGHLLIVHLIMHIRYL
jgi:hypothetical protein